VVLYAYAFWGIESFVRFNGIFTFAIWDDWEKELIFARDRFGVKPLYYSELSDGIVFGSEIKAILASGVVSPKMTHRSLHEFAYFGVSLG
jgi:asparagine synthase (glutamine-hydrolysing)